MKLTDLEPRWLDSPHEDTPRRGIGVGFRCPCSPACEHRIAVYFEQPLDGGVPWHPTNWARAGDTFETLTLSPSIDFRHGNGRWHGFVTNGEVTSC